MKKYLIVICCLSLCGCAVAKERPELEYQFPNCGTSQLNGKTINKVCATRDFIAPEPRKRKRDWLAFLAAEGSSGYKGPRDPVGGIFHFENKELDMQGHVWDFSKQKNPELVIRGHDSSIKNGIFLRSYLTLGSNEYLPPQFLNGRTFEENTSYAKFLTSGASIQNFNVINIKGDHKGISLNSWGAKIINCFFIINENMNLQGSKATIIHNNFFSDSRIPSEKKNSS